MKKVILILTLWNQAVLANDVSLEKIKNDFYSENKFFTTKDYTLNQNEKDKYIDLLNFKIEYTNCNKFNKRCEQSKRAYKKFEKKYKTAPEEALLTSFSEVVSEKNQKKIYQQIELDFEFSRCRLTNNCTRFQTINKDYKDDYPKDKYDVFDLNQALEKQRVSELQFVEMNSKAAQPQSELGEKLTEKDVEISELLLNSQSMDSNDSTQTDFDSKSKVDSDKSIDIESCQWDTKAIRPRLLSGSTCTGVHKICFGKVKCGDKSRYISCENKFCDNAISCLKAAQ